MDQYLIKKKPKNPVKFGLQSKKKIESKPIQQDSNLVLMTAQELDQPNGDIYKDMKIKMKNIFGFFDNLPVSDELDWDEANTIQSQHRILDRSNLIFPSMGDDNNMMSYPEISKMMITECKNSKRQKSSKSYKRRCENELPLEESKLVKTSNSGRNHF